MSKENKLAYVAGLLDGEGYFGIRKHKASNGSNPRYQELISIAMVEQEPIMLIKNLFGGNISIQKGTHRQLYRYEACDKITEKICNSLKKYLIVKKLNAILLLQMRKHKNQTTLKNFGKKCTTSNLEFREEHYINCKKNNSPHLYENK